jgi:hypothetical protein
LKACLLLQFSQQILTGTFLAAFAFTLLEFPAALGFAAFR